MSKKKRTDTMRIDPVRTDEERTKVYDITLPVRRRLAILKSEISERKKRLECMPEGYLKFKKDRYGFRYYQRFDTNDTSGHYLKKGELSTAKPLAQKEYDKKFVKQAEEEAECLMSFLHKYSKYDINSIYGTMKEGKRILVEPFVLDDEEYIKRWLSVEYSEGYFPEGYDEYYTMKGMRVHSKSEIIIADALDSYNIPYRYEFPICLDGKEKRPDFICLNVAKRNEYVWEHFGMMGVEEYAEGNVDKINKYIANGYYPGENAIFTFESRGNPLDTRTVKTMILRYLL